MPGNMNRRNKVSNRKQRNKRGRPNKTVSLSTPVPDRIVVNMKYAQSIELTATTTAAYYFFACNDIYDPNITGTGHQPLGHDQWNQFYDRFRVVGFDAKLTLMNTGAVPVLAGGILKPTTTATTDIETALEKDHGKILLIAPLDVSQRKTVSWRNQKPWTILGVSEATYRGEANYSGVNAGSPNFTVPVLQLVCQAADRLTSVTVRFIVEMTYKVELYERVSLTSS